MANTKILLVEDESIVAKDIQGILINLGYEVSGVVASGEEAVNKAEETQPDLVLMDIGLRGEIDGLEAAKKIQGSFNIPVVYLTAYADDKTLQRAETTQPFGIILKPVNEIDLHSALKKALYKLKSERKP